MKVFFDKFIIYSLVYKCLKNIMIYHIKDITYNQIFYRHITKKTRSNNSKQIKRQKEQPSKSETSKPKQPQDVLQ